MKIRVIAPLCFLLNSLALGSYGSPIISKESSGSGVQTRSKVNSHGIARVIRGKPRAQFGAQGGGRSHFENERGGYIHNPKDPSTSISPLIPVVLGNTTPPDKDEAENRKAPPIDEVFDNDEAWNADQGQKQGRGGAMNVLEASDKSSSEQNPSFEVIGTKDEHVEVDEPVLGIQSPQSDPKIEGDEREDDDILDDDISAKGYYDYHTYDEWVEAWIKWALDTNPWDKQYQWRNFNEQKKLLIQNWDYTRSDGAFEITIQQGEPHISMVKDTSSKPWAKKLGRGPIALDTVEKEKLGRFMKTTGWIFDTVLARPPVFGQRNPLTSLPERDATPEWIERKKQDAEGQLNFEMHEIDRDFGFAERMLNLRAKGKELVANLKSMWPKAGNKDKGKKSDDDNDCDF